MENDEKKVDQAEKYDFSIKLAETKFQKEEERVQSFNTKVSFYFTFVAISLSILTFFISSIKDYFQFKSINIEFSEVILLIYLIINVFGAIIFVFLIVFNFRILIDLLKALNPLKTMQPGYDVIVRSKDNNPNEAKAQYLKELLQSIKSNRETINRKYELLETINKQFEKIVYLFFIILICLLLNFIIGLFL